MANAFNVNNSELVKYANQLEKLNRSALPVAVRQTLNDAAFESKTKFVANEFNKQFTVRKKQFIKSHTAFNKSPNTFNIDQMFSEMGVIKGKSHAGDELIKQEFGGTIANRDYIPTDKSRVSSNASKLVSKKYYRTSIKQRNTRSIKKYKDFAKAAYYYGKNAIILFNNVLVEIRKISNRGVIKFKNIYSYEKGKTVNLKPAPFIAPAGLAASNNIASNYVKNAIRQINKYAR